MPASTPLGSHSPLLRPSATNSGQAVSNVAVTAVLTGTTTIAPMYSDAQGNNLVTSVTSDSNGQVATFFTTVGTAVDYVAGGTVSGNSYSGGNTFRRNVYPTPIGTNANAPRATTVPYAATITPNADTTEVLTISALTGNLTVANPSPATTVTDARLLRIRLQQDVTGGRSIVWGSQYVFPDDQPLSSVPTANKTRVDTATVTSGSSTISDTAIRATDQGNPVSGTGIPSGSFVGAVTPGVSFVLSSSATTSTAVNATAAGTSVSILVPMKWEMLFEWNATDAAWRLVGMTRGF